MSRKTKYKLRKLHTVLVRDIFNSRYIVRNTLVLMILATICGITATAANSASDRKKNSVEAETVSDSYIIMAAEDEILDPESISVLRTEFTEPDMDKAAVNVQSVTMSDMPDAAYDFVTDADSLNIRAKADPESEILGRLMKDAVGTVQGEDGEWTLISSGGISGYVKTEYILTGENAAERLEDCKKNLAVVTASEVNVRAEASTDSDILLLAKQGDTFVIDDTFSGSGWNRIRLADGAYAYISSEYIRIQAGYEEAVSIDSINALQKAKEAAADKLELEEEKKDAKEKSEEKDQQSDDKKNEQKKDDKSSPKNSDKKDEKNSTQNSDKKTEQNAASDKKTEQADNSDTKDNETPAKDNQVTTSTTSRGGFGLSDEDITLLACIVYAESGSESYEGQLAVANVVLNRLQSGRWGSTVSDVIYAPSQFTAVNTNAFTKAMANGPSGTSLSAAQAAAAGTNNIGGFMSFRPVKNAKTDSYSSYTIIGNHCFF